MVTTDARISSSKDQLSAVQMVRELVKEEETISRRSNNWIEGLTRR
jgi:hypothetical protein